MKKTYLIKEKLKLKYILGTYLNSDEYSCYDDALYDIFRYMEDKGSDSISHTSIHYALKFKVDGTYIDELTKWAVSNGYLDANVSSTKTSYKILRSPFK
jgi:hypothetical protein